MRAIAPTAGAAQTLQEILQRHAEEVADRGRRIVGPVIDDRVASGLPGARGLSALSAREVVRRLEDGSFFVGEEAGDDRPTLRDVATREVVAQDVPEDAVEEAHPNGGVRRVIGTALVQFQFSDPDARGDAVKALSRSLEPDQIAPLERSIRGETDPALKARKEQRLACLRARYGATTDAHGRAGVARRRPVGRDARGAEPDSRHRVPHRREAAGRAAGRPRADPRRGSLPRNGACRARGGLARRGRPTRAEVKAALEANIVPGRVGGLPVAQLSSESAPARIPAARPPLPVRRLLA